MSLIELLAVISCGLFYAGADFTRKKASTSCAPEMLIAVAFTVIAPLFWALAVLSQDMAVGAGYILPGAANVVSNVLANIFFVRAVAVSDLSKTIPLLSLTLVLAAFLGLVFLGEVLSLQQWLGIVLVMFGVLCLYAPANRPFDFAGMWHNFSQEKGAKYMCGVAVFWTLAPVFDRVALRYTSVAMDGAIHFTAGALLLWAWLYFRGGLTRASLPRREGWGGIILFSLLYAGAMGTQMAALKLVYVGILESVKRVITQLSSLILGRLAFNEPITRQKTIAVVLMCLGTPMIIL